MKVINKATSQRIQNAIFFHKQCVQRKLASLELLLTFTHHLGASPLGPTPFLQSNYSLRFTGHTHRLSGQPGASEKPIAYSTTQTLSLEQ